MVYSRELEKKLSGVIKQLSLSYKDKKVGALVSGGIDSSTIAFYLNKYLRNNLHLFSFGTSNSFDAPYLKILEKLLNKKVKFLQLDNIKFEPYLKKVIRLLKLNNLPLNLTQVSLGLGYYLIFEQISKQNIEVVFTGQGPDVFLAGYHKYKTINLQNGNSEIKKDYKMLEVDKKRDSLMAKEWGIELVNPYFDKKLVEFFEKIPFNLKLKKTKNGFTEKYILRKVGEINKMPSEIIWRPKKGFQYSSRLQNKIKPLYIKIISSSA